MDFSEIINKAINKAIEFFFQIPEVVFVVYLAFIVTFPLVDVMSHITNLRREEDRKRRALTKEEKKEVLEYSEDFYLTKKTFYQNLISVPQAIWRKIYNKLAESEINKNLKDWQNVLDKDIAQNLYEKNLIHGSRWFEQNKLVFYLKESVSDEEFENLKRKIRDVFARQKFKGYDVDYIFPIEKGDDGYYIKVDYDTIQNVAINQFKRQEKIDEYDNDEDIFK